jgi:two-component system sensor histidine kinase RegB
MPLRTEFTTTRSSASSLRNIFLLRNIALTAQTAAIGVAVYVLGIDIPVVPLAGILAAMLLVNAATRVRLARSSEIGDAEILGQILLDVAALSGLLFFTGGSTNPFTVFYLLPLTLAAMMLPKRLMWIVVASAAFCYSMLLLVHVPLRPLANDHELMMNMHIVGMWLTFLISAGLIAHFVSGIRDSNILLTQARETMLRNERILALGTLAAGAAHELGTPLSTIGVLAKELQDEYAMQPALVEDLALLNRQVEVCRNTITNLLASAGQTRFDNAAAIPVNEFVGGVIEKWRLIRPVVHFENRIVGKPPVPAIIADETLSQALMNLLNNAADASPEHVEIQTDWKQSSVVIDVSDRGPGFAEDAIRNAGKAFFSTKNPDGGRGLGLYLAKAAVERVGGSLLVRNRDGGGSSAQLVLPVAQQGVNA